MPDDILALTKFYLVTHSMGQNCNRTACKCKVYFFINFMRPESPSTNSAAVHHISICGGQRTQRIKLQIAEQGLLDFHEDGKELLFVFLLIFVLFFEAITLLFNHIT